MLNRSASLAMSTSVLKALPGKLDIKRHSPSILYILAITSRERIECRLAPVLKTIFHQCVVASLTLMALLKQSHQSKTGYKYMI